METLHRAASRPTLRTVGNDSSVRNVATSSEYQVLLGPMRWARVLGSFVLAMYTILLFAPSARAYSTGVVVPGCGCHSGGMVPKVTLLTPKDLPDLGETITISVVIQAINGDTGGFFLFQADGEGTLTAGPGERQPMPSQVVHSMPGRAVNGEVRFDVSWTAPETPGVAYFQAYAVSANGSGAPTGDNFGSGGVGVAVGCASAMSATYYYDSDKDGFGTAAMGIRPGCGPILGWALAEGDCDENRPEVNPGQPEVCNLKDDDCDGKVDEGVENALVYPDKDEDGYGDPNGTPGDNCGKRGYAPNNLDCDDSDPAIRPLAEEVCNYFDDDCDGEADERVRPRCGVGACTRTSPTCEPTDCSPGLPEDEICDLLDNDCDGSLDEGLSCDPGTMAAGSAPIGGSGGMTESRPASAGGGPMGAPPAAASATAPAQSSKPGQANSGGCHAGRAHRGSSATWLAWGAALVLLWQRRKRIAQRAL
jgi:hypothetical protein